MLVDPRTTSVFWNRENELWLDDGVSCIEGPSATDAESKQTRVYGVWTLGEAYFKFETD